MIWLIVLALVVVLAIWLAVAVFKWLFILAIVAAADLVRLLPRPRTHLDRFEAALGRERGGPLGAPVLDR